MQFSACLETLLQLTLKSKSIIRRSFCKLLLSVRICWDNLCSCSKVCNWICRGKKERSYWYLIHWILGTIVSLVGIINIYTGLKAYHQRTLKSTTLWTIIFTVEVTFIGLIYLFQDKLEYMKKQGVIGGSESILSSHQDIIPHRQNQKELLPVACGIKRNALGNLFD